MRKTFLLASVLAAALFAAGLYIGRGGNGQVAKSDVGQSTAWNLSEPVVVDDSEAQAEADSALGPIVTSSSGGDGGASYVEGEVLVTFDANITEGALRQRFAEDLGVAVESIEVVSIDSENEKVLALIRYEGDYSAPDICESLSQLDYIEDAEPDYILTLCEDVSDERDADVSSEPAQADGVTSLASVETNDPSESIQWEHEAIGINDAWETATSNHEVTVVVIDSGVDYDHPDLEDNLILGTYAKNLCTDTVGSVAVDDVIGHGTHVAGIVAAVANNGVGTAGGSYNANVLPLKVTYDSKGNMRTSDVVKAIEYAVALKTSDSSPDELKAIRVINMSLGGYTKSSSWESAVQRALDAGITVVAAAGNDSKNQVMYPAAFDDVIGVSALKETSDGEKFASEYSNYGELVDLSAPGTAIYSTVLNGDYGYKRGTSMATPSVAAVAALVYSLDMDATPSYVEEVLIESALDLGDEGRDAYYGYGEVQADAAVQAVAATLISRAEVSEIPAQVYSGDAITPSVTVTLDGVELTEGADYSVSYSNNTEAGVGEATIVGTGDYCGSKTVTFVIEPKKIAVPTAATGLVYNGSEQTGVAAGEGYELSGDIAATEAGDYVATATLVSGNYVWEDGTAEPKEIAWLIEPAEESSTVRRVWGQTALDTMAAVSQEGFLDGSCDSVVLATSGGYWDALSATALAGRLGCPVLLTPSSSLAGQAASEIERLGAGTVYIAGGPLAVSEGVEAQVRALGAEVVRVAGDDAQLTALEVYEEGLEHGGWGTTAIVATSETFHDALSAAPYAYAKGAPVFLTNSDGTALDDRVLSAIRDGGFERVLVIGGTLAIKQGVVDQLSGLEVTRLAGDTAIETSSAVTGFCFSEGMTAAHVGVATGSDYYDALTGASLCGNLGSPLVLALDSNRSAIDAVLGANAGSVETAYVFGGELAVSADTYAAVEAALGL